jgi:transposase InsO family protein
MGSGKNTHFKEPNMEKKITDWGHLRFSIVSSLLSSPPEKGQLGEAIRALAEQFYRHPHKDKWVQFGASTIERWYYRAAHADDPVAALGRKVRSDAGCNRAMDAELLSMLSDQYIRFPRWSYQLHTDNLRALTEERPELGEAPSYSTVRRRMTERGWFKKKQAKTKGRKIAAARLEKREVRSFESGYVHGLWHLDFHTGSLRVVDTNGDYHSPKVLCVLDDCSRVCCHLQWYLDETADSLLHSLKQAFQKRGLPRSLMTDNGAAMLAGETTNGLRRLGIEHETTLPYSPYQNGKQETFWAQLEGRLLAMLAAVEPLTLEFLNQATQAWVEMEYNRNLHDELKTSPLDRMLEGPDVSRLCPENEHLMFAFTVCVSRMQRRSDGTVQICGVRFEIPSRFRHISRLYLCYRNWDLSRAFLIDRKTDNLLAEIRPLDKTGNSSGKRRALVDPAPQISSGSVVDDPYPPLLRKLLRNYAATGIPPAYIVKESGGDDNAR